MIEKIKISCKTWQIAYQAVQPDALALPEKIKVEYFNTLDASKRKQALSASFAKAVYAVGGDRVLHNMTCFNADHEDRTPSMVFDKGAGHFHCYGCMETGINWDAYDTIGAAYGLTSFRDCYDKAVELYVDEPARVIPASVPYKDIYPKAMYRTMKNPYYTPIAKDPDGLEYLKSRGIRKATAVKYGVLTWEYQGCLYLVFPNDNGSVVRRKFARTDEANMYCNEPEKWWNQKGSGGIFNLRAVEKATVDNPIVYVTESATDALSAIESGYSALSINSVNNIGGLIRETTYPYLVGLFDNDNIGRMAASIFQQHGYFVCTYDPEEYPFLCQHKDANEALVASKTRAKADLATLNQNAKEFYGLSSGGAV